MAAVYELEAADISHNDISIVANNVDKKNDPTDHNAASKGAGGGAAAGAVVGGGAGLLAGLGMLAIPGVGPVVAAGWLVATAAGAAVGAGAGAATGGIVGRLTEYNVSKKDAELYAEIIRRGGALVSVKADDKEVARVNDIFSKVPYIDPDARRSAYQASDWTTFDPAAPAYTTAEIAAERSRYL